MLRRLPLLPRIRVVCSRNMSTTPGPICRKFVPVEQSEVTSISKPARFKFSLVSYNILAQAFVKSAFFPHSPAPCLKWKARSQVILTVLKSLEPDFFCLQEVDEYDTFYKKNMESLGYASVYTQRSGRKRDGCGIFYKQNAELVMEEKIDYNDLVDLVEDGKTSTIDDDQSVATPDVKDESKAGSQLKSTQGDRGDPHDPHVRLKRDCVGIMALFRLKNPACHHVIIANPHIYWDPEWADVKIAQVRYLLACLAGFKELVSNKFDCTPSVIVAGDFNSVPGDQVYQYLVSGTSLVGPERADDLPLPLSSVYAFTRGEPEFTNCTPGFTGTLDYILFSPCGDITPVSYLDLPGSESPDVTGGLPNNYHPSDHLPIGAEFEVNQVYQYLVSGTSSVGPESADDLPLPLSSVYAFTRGEPEFTNCTPGFTGTIDYILFSPSGDITPVSCLDLPRSESSDVTGGLPNYYHPSDHLPIGAEFEVNQI